VPGHFKQEVQSRFAGRLNEAKSFREAEEKEAGLLPLPGAAVSN